MAGMPRRSPSFVALIGDLAASRSFAPKPRAKLQRHLTDWLAELNELGPEVLAAPLTLTAGDQVQGLFRKPGVVVEVIQELTDRMFGSDEHPYAHFGVGRGTLTTGAIPVPPDQALNPALLDGPAFHRAKEGLERAQRDKQWVRFVGFGGANDGALNALFGLMGAIRGRWTARQGIVSYRARALDSQKDLATKLQVNPSVVSETLKSACHNELLTGEDAARLLLEACAVEQGGA